MKKIILVFCILLASAMTAFPQENLNVSYSPDRQWTAYTRANDLYVKNVASGEETRLTFDGTELILNGYASWVYFEEIFGRPSKYKAFWWSPDSKKIGYYRFDNTDVTLFPIFSPFGQDGSLRNTRYPKAGEANPKVRIAMVNLEEMNTVWADFDEGEDCYYGTPFWGEDSENLYVSKKPRTQNTLDLYAVNCKDGAKKQVYHEQYKTWIDFLDNITFTKKGLYMVRSFETGWEQIYFLSYDGSEFKRLTDGPNWKISIVKVDQKNGDVWFTAQRDSRIREGLYRVDRKGVITCLSDPQYTVISPEINLEERTCTYRQSNTHTAWQTVKTSAYKAWDKYPRELIKDSAGDFDLANMGFFDNVVIENEGFELYGQISYPKDFDENKQYPVVIELYGGPGSPYVRDMWGRRTDDIKWFRDNGIIYMMVDPRSSGENGRRGTDEAYLQLTVSELKDYVAWAKWLQEKPYVKADKICVEGFSFGGTTTVMLLCQYPQYFHYGIAGGGVYDWTLYDSFYTEIFMDTPQNNPDGYARATAKNYVDSYPVTYENYDGSCMLRLTHGTGDDNVHFQNTLQLVDELQKKGKKFELMIYPDGMHGYNGAQGKHSDAADRDFWMKYLLGKEPVAHE